MATISVISSFGTSAPGPLSPSGELLIDSSGNVLGGARSGGANGDGAVFEVAHTGSGYASSPTTVASFDGADGSGVGPVIADASGDLLGVATGGGANGDGTIFEIAKTADGYVSTPTVLASFDGANGVGPTSALAMDSAGDLFGVAETGGFQTTIFELAKTASGYASAPTALAAYNSPFVPGPLAMDANGDIFATTIPKSGPSTGSVIEIANNGGTYASTPTTLATFSGADGTPGGSLVTDAAGNLFGMTDGGGANGTGEIFEIAKTAGGYASSPTVLASFPSTLANGDVNNDHSGSLLIDGADNLFMTRLPSGGAVDGELFELAKTHGIYASAVTDVTSLNGGGSNPEPGLVADSSGNLYGADSGTYPMENSPPIATVWKIAGSGFMPTSAATGETIGVNDTAGEQLTGTPLNDTFYAGQNSVVMTGDGGADTFIFSALPWNAGSITDFNTASDKLDFSAIFHSIGYTGSNPVADGYLQFASDGHGDTVVSVNPQGPSTQVPITITTLDSVSPSSITPADYGFGSGGGSGTIKISGTVANQQIEDNQTATPFSNVTVADSNSGATETLTITLSEAANGTLSNLDGGSYNAATGIYTDNGTTAQITAALDGLVFDPTQGQVAAGDTVTTTFTISDSDSAGATASDSNTTVVTTAAGSGGQTGETLTANDTAGQHLTGTPHDDTLYAGHNSVVMTGDGGADSFIFQYLPWNAGSITDFNTAADHLDLSGIFSTIGYTGSNPVGDGYLQFASDGQGDTQVYVNAHSSSDPWPTLITTLDGVSPSSITPADYGIGSGGGGGGGQTVDDSQPSYTAPAGVTNIILTGSAAQTVTANNQGDTITSNDYGSTLNGGTGNDAFIAGHGADQITGNGGNDSFVFNYQPWNAGQVTDFNTSTDTLDLTGLMKSIGYTGSNPVADGYVNFADDGHGDTVVYVNPQGPGTQIPITVTTLDHVSASALHQTGDYMFA